jgi:hypothetical protein
MAFRSPAAALGAPRAARPAAALWGDGFPEAHKGYPAGAGRLYPSGEGEGKPYAVRPGEAAAPMPGNAREFLGSLRPVKA